MPLDFSLARLAISLTLFLLAVLLVLRSVNPISHLLWSGKAANFAIFLLVSFVLGIRLVHFAISQNVVPIVALSVALFSMGVTYALVYLFGHSAGRADENATFVHTCRYEIALAVVILITALPLLTQPYFYYDDWWNIGNRALEIRQILFTWGRPLQSLLSFAFDFVTIRNGYVSKWVFLPAMLLYSTILYRWFYARTQDELGSFALAGILSVFGPAMDLLGYTATSAVCYSILFSALSVVCFDRAHEFFSGGDRRSSAVNLLLAFALLFTALLTYQIGPQIVFLLLSVDVFFKAPNRALFRKHAAYLLLFAASYAFYLLFVRLVGQLYGVGITTNRSEIIGSLSQLIQKAQFYVSILKQCAMQVVAALTGDSLILERYHGAIISFLRPLAGNILLALVLILVLIAVASYWLRTRSLFGVLTLIAYMPMSFFVFLVLSEGGYLTYYAFAQISLVMFYFIMGVSAASRFVWGTLRRLPICARPIACRPMKPAYVAIPLLVVCALVSNYYVTDFYIDYNTAVYGFVKHSLQTALSSTGLQRIHVFGSISPINADVYSRFITETALKDLGRDPAHYAITFSRNRYFLARLQEADYLRIRASVSRADRQELDKNYALDTTYRQYYLKATPPEADWHELQRIFIAAGAIPQSNAPGTLIIDLTWTDQAYLNSAR